MNAKQVLHQEKLNKWVATFHEQRESGLTVRDWCSQNSVSPYAFFYWKRMAKEAYVQAMIPKSQPLSSDDSTESHELYNLRELSSPQPSPSSSVTLSLPGVRIEFDESASDERILQVLKAVRHV